MLWVVVVVGLVEVEVRENTTATSAAKKRNEPTLLQIYSLHHSYDSPKTFTPNDVPSSRPTNTKQQHQHAFDSEYIGFFLSCYQCCKNRKEPGLLDLNSLYHSSESPQTFAFPTTYPRNGQPNQNNINIRSTVKCNSLTYL